MERKKKTNKKIIIGICGSISAWKTCDLIRKLKKNGFEVKCIITEAGEKFITPLTLQTISGNKVYKDMFENISEYQPEHISLADWADLVAVVPATLTTISKIANGIADNLLVSVIMATKSPVLIAPAMNTNMWLNPVNQKNVDTLKKLGYKFIGPVTGDLICDKKGRGHLAPIDVIYKKILETI